MTILNVNFGTAGESDIKPRIVRIQCNDALAAIQVAGWANSLLSQGYFFDETDAVFINYGTDSASFGIFRPTVDSSGVTLSGWANPAQISGALVSGNLIKANNSAGVIQDAGFAMIRGISAPWNGGATNHTFTATGVTNAMEAHATIISQTNNAAITTVITNTDSITVNFTVDPGTSTEIYWTATK